MSYSKEWPYAADPSDSDRLGIAFSGGGIRSASFCLGAYQYLSQRGIFGRATFISAVSGGSYIAGAIAVALANSDETSPESPEVWAHGSPEERHLRNNLSYLAPGPRGRSWLAANFVYGLLLNIVPLYLVLFILGRAYGIALWYFYPGIGSRSFERTRMVYVIAGSAALVFISIVLVAASRVKSGEEVARSGPLRRSRYERAAEVTLISAIVLVLIGAIAPYLLHFLARLLAASAPILTGGLAEWMPSRALLSAEALCVFWLLGAGAILLLRIGRLRSLRTALAWLSGLGLLGIPFLFAAEAAITRPPEVRRDVGLIAIAAAAELIFAACIPSRLYSMHLYYRDRLSRAFMLRRDVSEARIVAEPMPYSLPVRFSDVGRLLAAKRAQGLHVPSFVVCAAVAAREGDVPHKSWATSFTFGEDISTSPELRFRVPTAELERSEREGGAHLTLPSMMAISGAALSPLMGRFSLPAFRLLMAVLNLRLGVWIPNPSTHKKSHGGGALRRVLHRFLSRLREPGALYAVREGLGLVRSTSRYVHVSDGGHWENLGLVELIRRRCTHILVLDASAGVSSGLGDIGRAAAVARAELGADISLDPRTTVPAGDSGLAESPVAIGTVEYPDGMVGEIYYARSVLWPGAPVDMQIFREMDRSFPRHPTSNQLFSGEQFDAYRALGWAVAREVIDTVNPSWDLFDLDDDDGTSTLVT